MPDGARPVEDLRDDAPTAPARLKLTLSQHRAMGEHGILPWGAKLALCARAGVPRYWIVDFQDTSVVEFTMPDGERYRGQRRLRPGDRRAIGDPCSQLDGLEIDAGEVLG